MDDNRLSDQKGLGRSNAVLNGSKQIATNYLLLIAIDQYKHWPKLYNCVNDAKKIIDLLKSKYTFDQENIKLIKNEKATRQNIFKAFKFYKQHIRSSDNLIIFFIGHGQIDLIEEKTMGQAINTGFWIPFEAERQEYADFISTDDIRMLLRPIKAFHLLLIVDACFGGTIFNSHTDRSLRALSDRQSRWGISACHSRELASDGPPGGNSPFTEILIDILKNQIRYLQVDTK